AVEDNVLDTISASGVDPFRASQRRGLAFLAEPCGLMTQLASLMKLRLAQAAKFLFGRDRIVGDDFVPGMKGRVNAVVKAASVVIEIELAPEENTAAKQHQPDRDRGKSSRRLAATFQLWIGGLHLAAGAFVAGALVAFAEAAGLLVGGGGA